MANRISAASKQEADIREKICSKTRKEEGYDFVVSHLHSLRELNELLAIRSKQYKQSNEWLSEWVINGKLLLTGRGTVQIIYHAHICGTMRIPKVLTWREFNKVAISIRTGKIKIPKVGDICPKCRKPYKIDEVLDGNLMLLDVRDERVVHHHCPR